MRDGKMIAGLLTGAGLVYILDPDRGARRRALVRDRVVHAAHKLGDGLDTTARDLRNRASGTAAGLRSGLRREEVDDQILHERVRSALGRVVSHPSAITVSVSGGRVALRGPVLAHEVNALLDRVRQVRGVSDVVNELDVHRDAGGVPALQGGRPREERAELAQENWAPATRVLTGTLGSLLGYQGFRRGGAAGSLITALGIGVLARALTNLPAKRLTGIGAGRRAIDLQKVINVNAPVGQVWALWSNYENFPRFMAHLKEVRRQNGQSHWVAAGPAGVPIEWDAITTASVPNELIAWKSVEGAPVENAGTVRFRPNPDGSTQVDIKLTYNPPGGALGHAAASLLGADPKRAMDEDMVRLKSLLEEGKTRADQEPVYLEDLTNAPADRPPTG
jgi:uncharacterized membrane protein